jgi:hypothetical protein
MVWGEMGSALGAGARLAWKIGQRPWRGSPAMSRRLMSAVLRVAIASILGVRVAATGASGATGGFARPELLAETAWLAQHLNDSGIRIIGMCSEACARRGRTKRAIFQAR